MSPYCSVRCDWPKCPHVLRHRLGAASVQNYLLEQDGAGKVDWRSVAQMTQYLHPRAAMQWRLHTRKTNMAAADDFSRRAAS